jgi:uncharacterized protein DUF2490
LKIIYSFFGLLLLIFISSESIAQVNESELGAWYMYFFNVKIKDSRWGMQGDVQYRNWNTGGDLQQLLLRGGVTYKPGVKGVSFNMGYAHISAGKQGSDNSTINENRIYQDVVLSQNIDKIIYIKHRFRFEERWIEQLNFRTRIRYQLNISIPLNKKNFNKGALYIAAYNELMLNGQKDIGLDKTVEYFNQNRIYGSIGYSFTDKLKVRAGYMHNIFNKTYKGQLQVSIHQIF